MSIAIYLFVSVLTMLLLVYGFISINWTLFIYVTMVLILYLVEINRIEKLKRSVGEIVIQLESEFKTSKISLLWGLLIIVLYFRFILAYRVINQALGYCIFFVLLLRFSYELYLSISVRTTFSDRGILIRGIMIKWSDIELYEWQELRFSFIKGYSRLFIKKKTKLSLGEFYVKISDFQRSVIDELLRQKLGLGSDTIVR